MPNHPVYPLNITDDSQLLLCPCPGTAGQDLSSSVQELCYKNSPAMLTMMTSEELKHHEVDSLPQVAVRFDVQWFHLPIADDSIPDQEWEDKFQSLLPRFKQLLNSGLNLTLHCKGGSGRTGLVAARLMLAMGYSLEDSIAQIKALRPNAFTADGQLDYIKQFAN